MASNGATIICPQCGARETAVAEKHEDDYGTGGFGTFDDFQEFEVTVRRDQEGPFVDTATCKKCSVRADVMRLRQ
jgi:hypothetical protein